VNEVSCRALDPFFQAVDRRGIERSRLVDGLTYELRFLQDRHERIDWDAFRQFMANVRKIFTTEELVEIGAVGLKSPGFKSFALIGRTLFSASGFYRWMLTSGGMGNQLFSNMSPSFRELGPGRIDLDLQVAPGYENCPDFFDFASGGFKAIPELVGLPTAKVVMVRLERGARFEIEFEASESRRARLLRWLTRKSDARATAKELNDTIRALEIRNEELERARAQVERQRELLDVAYRLGHEVSSERDLTRVATAVASTLLARAGVVGVRVTITAFQTVTEERGTAKEAPILDWPLPKAGLGKIEVWGTDIGDLELLLELVAPTLVLAVDNAEYQFGLEKLVSQRTAELQVAVDQLKVAQASRENFFGNISHEIRTPLSLILLAARDIESRGGAVLDQRSREGLVGISEGARKLLRLVDELLLLAAGQVDKLKLSVENADVSALTRQIVAAWRPAAEAAELQLELSIPDGLVMELDPTAIERVISNLMSNAVKYTSKGGRIDIAVAVEGADVRLSISDTGRGIDPDLATRLFGRFERAAGDDRRKAGTGIGLALVKQLVEAHGGTIAAYPRKPVGTEFRILLPQTLIRSEAGVTTQLRTTHAPTSISKLRSGQVFTPPGLSLGTIVIAEDEPRLAESIATLLSERYTVIVALDGAAALEQVKKHQPQLLVTDVDMPNMTGIELAQRFREVTGDRLAPIIILSAMIDLNTRLAGLEAGAIDYVGKPFEPKELMARVDAQFRMRELAVRLHRAEQVSSLGILTSGLAHELRNPANGVVNSLDPLREALPPELTVPESDVGQLFEAIKTSSEQILALVNQLLGFNGSTEILMRPAVISDLVARSVRLASGALKGIEVRQHLAAQGTVMCAPALMVQVLTNLVENAGHAAGSGGWVEIRTTMREGRVTFEVTDSGPGVPPELRDRIFEPFFTTKPQGRGTGLGLSVARTVVFRHKGTLELRQREGRTAFVIELPSDTNSVRSLVAL
jgi:signal transduction histidine kinase